MTKIFYDHLLIFEKIDVAVKNANLESGEKEELWNLIEDIIHYKVMEAIFDLLPRNFHDEFLDKFHTLPYNYELIKFLNEKSGVDIEKELSEKLEKLENELLSDLNLK